MWTELLENALVAKYLIFQDISYLKNGKTKIIQLIEPKIQRKTFWIKYSGVKGFCKSMGIDMFINIRYYCTFQASSRMIFLWITVVYLNFSHWNFWHRRKPWLSKYLLHRNLQIVIQGRVKVKKKKKQCLFFSNLYRLLMLSGQPSVYLTKRAIKTPISFFIFNKFENCFTLVNNNIYW